MPHRGASDRALARLVPAISPSEPNAGVDLRFAARSCSFEIEFEFGEVQNGSGGNPWEYPMRQSDGNFPTKTGARGWHRLRLKFPDGVLSGSSEVGDVDR
jgi:hypothetical protein